MENSEWGAKQNIGQQRGTLLGRGLVRAGSQAYEGKILQDNPGSDNATWISTSMKKPSSASKGS